MPQMRGFCEVDMSEPFITWISSCGRLHLMVGGIALATEGDRCRDPDVGEPFWTDEGIKMMAESLQKKLECRDGHANV